MPTIFITGANRGLGLQCVKAYKEKNWRILACCRKPDNALELKSILDNYDNAKIIKLDLYSDDDIYALTEKLHEEKIDILLNNAGVIGSREDVLGNIDANEWFDTLRVNTVAPLLITRALINQVVTSDLKIIANMSSSMGSIAENESGHYYYYRSSKAALNAVTKSLAVDLKNRGVIAVVLHPGWVKTDMGGPNAYITAEESVVGIVDILSALKPSDSGSFLRYDGGVVKW